MAGCAGAAAAQVLPPGAAARPSASMPAKAAGWRVQWMPTESEPASAARPAMPSAETETLKDFAAVETRPAAHFATVASEKRAAAPAPRRQPVRACRSNRAAHCARSAGTAPCPPCPAAWRERPDRRPDRSGWLWCRDSSCAKNLAHAPHLARVHCGNPPQERRRHRTFWR